MSLSDPNPSKRPDVCDHCDGTGVVLEPARTPEEESRWIACANCLPASNPRWRIEGVTSRRRASMDEFPTWEEPIWIETNSTSPLVIEAIEDTPGLDLHRLQEGECP